MHKLMGIFIPRMCMTAQQSPLTARLQDARMVLVMGAFQY